MDLRSRKYIKNSHALSGFEDGLPRFTGNTPSSLWATNTLNKLGIGSNPHSSDIIGGHSPEMLYGLDTPEGRIAAVKDLYFQKDTPSSEDNEKGLNTPKRGPLFKFDKEALPTAIPAAMTLVGQLADMATYDGSASDIYNSADRTTKYIGGVGYLTKRIDEDAVRREFSKGFKCGKLPRYANGLGGVLGAAGSGAAAGSVLGPWGAVAGGALGAIGGLLAGNSAEDLMEAAIREAKRNVGIENVYNRAAAYGQSLSENAKNWIDSSNTNNLGKYADGKPVYSAFGPTNAEATARVSNGELIGNFEDGYVYRVPGKKNNNDSKLAAVRPNDFIITNKYGLSDEASLTGDFIGVLNKLKNIMGYKNGRLPGFVNGMAGAIPSWLGMAMGINLYFDAKRLNISRSNSYKEFNPTPYTNKLRSLHINEKPIINLITGLQALVNDLIDKTGGLSGALKASAYLGALNTTQNNTYNALANNQAMNNQYLANSLNADMQYRAQNAQRGQQAIQSDRDYYSRAHAARQQGMQTGMFNVLSQWQNWLANMFKYNQFERTMKLYEDDHKLDLDKYNQSLANSKNSYVSPEFMKYIAGLMNNNIGRFINPS